MTDKVSPAAKVAAPVMTGVVSLVVCDTTVGTLGAVVSITSSPVVASTRVLPAASVTLASTS